MASVVIISSAVLGLLVPILTFVCFRKEKDMDWEKSLSSPAWDFSRSWATTFSAAGTAISFSAISSAFTTPPTFHVLSKQLYVSLGAIAVAMAVLAPVVFNVVCVLLRSLEFSRAAAVSFLISAGISIGAVTLQLSCGSCLLWELRLAGVLPQWAVLPMTVAVVMLTFAMLPYGVVTARDTLRKTDTAGQRKGFSRMAPAADRPDAWHLL